MKNILLPAMLFLATAAGAQAIHWGPRQADSKQMIYLQTGLEYGLTYGAGYAYRLSTRWPAMLNADFSAPSGQKIVDDFKVRLGGQIQLLRIGDVHLSGQLYGVFRRLDNEFATLVNFGSEATAVVGYYRRAWFVAGEFGFDKAIVTNFQHTQAYRDVYPSVQDGWFEPATGGVYHYGLQTGVAFGRNGITLKAGRLVNQRWDNAPRLPYYATLGYSRGF
jgi:hypothetical protein